MDKIVEYIKQSREELEGGIFDGDALELLYMLEQLQTKNKRLGEQNEQLHNKNEKLLAGIKKAIDFLREGG